MNLSKQLSLVLVFICCFGLIGCASKTASAYTEPEKLVSDFMDQYFNASLEDAQMRFEEGDIHMPLEEFFTEEGLAQAVDDTYPLMMFSTARQFQSDIILVDSEITLADDASVPRYNFQVTVEYPTISVSDEIEKYMDVQETDDGVKVTSKINGYIDVQETSDGWIIQSFKVQSADGSY